MPSVWATFQATYPLWGEISLQIQCEMLVDHMAMENPFSFLGTVFLAILFVAVSVMGTSVPPDNAKTRAVTHEVNNADTGSFVAATPADERATAAFSHQMAGGSCAACVAVFEISGADLRPGSFEKAKPRNDGQFAAFADSPPQHPPRT